jgi:hypothetical protein
MTPRPASPSRHSLLLRRSAWATLIALRSTIVILAIPLLALVIRDHGWKWYELRKVVLPNYPFAAMVFLAAWIWSFWFRRTAQDESPSSLSSTNSHQEG